VASDEQQDALVAAATSVLDPAGITVELTIDADAAIDDATVGQLGALVAAMPQHLASGVAGYDATSLYVSGVYVDEPARAAFESAAAAVGADVALEPRPAASPADAAAVESELNALVAAQPILFQPSSAELDTGAAAVLDRVAGVAKRFAGVTVTVEGHTDSSGDAGENQLLSDARAAAVVEALVARGVPTTDLAAEGFGESQPVLVDGVEDRQASRRVQFRAEATP
jgi:OOP family OmpA-OmpF porin